MFRLRAFLSTGVRERWMVWPKSNFRAYSSFMPHCKTSVHFNKTQNWFTFPSMSLWLVKIWFIPLTCQVRPLLPRHLLDGSLVFITNLSKLCSYSQRWWEGGFNWDRSQETFPQPLISPSHTYGQSQNLASKISSDHSTHSWWILFCSIS